MPDRDLSNTYGMNTPRLASVLPLAAALLAVAAIPSATSGPLVGTVGAGYFGTNNVSLDMNVPINSGTAGARVVDDKLIVTDQNGLTVYDVSDASMPVPQGFVAIPQQYYFTEEDVPSNGEIALVGQFGDLTPSIRLNVVDVSLEDNLGGQPTVIGTLSGMDEHTFECARDCTYAYGSAGSIIDLTDPTKPKDVGEWDDHVRAQTDPLTGAAYKFDNSTHDVTEIVPGILLTSSNPMFLLDVRETPLTPKVIGTGSFTDKRFIHANVWPYHGALPQNPADPAAEGWSPDWSQFDDFVLVGGETGKLGTACGKNDGAFMTLPWKRVTDVAAKDFGMIRMTHNINGGQGDEYRPKPDTFTDGGSAYSQFCTHWLTTRPGYRDGGLLAIGWYEFGVRFLDVAPDTGKITEHAWLIPMGGSTSAAYWLDEDTVYTADYQRGVDIISYDDSVEPNADEVITHEGVRFERQVLEAPTVLSDWYRGYGCPLPR